MDCIKDYLNSLSPTAQAKFAKKCGTTVGYLRKAVSAEQKLGTSLIINLERHSGGAISCERVRNDIDWAYLRGTPRPAESRSA
jgi:DNA-binding transcriptional regulator YdaS (Cro superfamily)